MHPSRTAASRLRAVTIIEVLVSSMLILLSMAGIFAINTRCFHLLRSTRQTAASSQILQQRVEFLRSRPWSEISNSTALANLMLRPMESEMELGDAALAENVIVSIPPGLDAVQQQSARPFTVVRQRGTSQIPQPGDLGAEPVLLFEIVLNWRGVQKDLQRRQRALICRTGMTQSGICGSAFGRPTRNPVTAPTAFSGIMP
jgi:hypothetical protein